MPERKLRLLYRMQWGQNTVPTESCPDAATVAALFESGGHSGEQAALRAHIADCPYCAAQLAATRPSPAYRNRYLGIAAALAVVAISTMWFQPDNGLVPGDHVELRSVREPQATPTLTFPTEGQVVDRSNMTVQWAPVSDAMHYSIRIVDDYGRIIDQAITDTPEYTVPPNLRLAPDTAYYVKVDAYLVGDKAVSSNHIYFRVSE